MKLRVVIVGIPGAGKTTIVEMLHKMLEGSRLVTFGTVMLEEGMKLGLVKNRDELRKLPVEKQRELQSHTATTIARMEQNVLLVDTHLFIRTKEGFWPGLPFDVVRALKPTHLVLVEARGEEIVVRRSADKTRYRDPATLEDLLAEMQLARSLLTVSSTLTGAPMMIVTNSDGKAEAVASEIAAVVREAFS